MMWIMFLSAILLVTLTSAEYLYDSNPYAHYGGYAASYDNYKPTDYKFEYGVSDPHTGDHKSQWEVKENGVVRGAYSLLEPDGTTRVVEYYADDTGFHADVKKIGTAVHDAPHYEQLHSLAEAHTADSLAYNGYGHGGVTHSYGAPIAAVAKVAAPVPIHAAPIAQGQHIAPVPQVIAPQIHHAGTPLNFDYGQQDLSQFYAAPDHYPSPVLQHPAPFKVATPHLVHQHSYDHQPQILHSAYENHQYQPEVVVKSYNYPAPDALPQFHAKYLEHEPQLVKTYAEPQQLVKTYAEPQLVKTYSEPQQLDKSYAEPQLVQTYAEPQQLVKAFSVPTQEYLQDPDIQKSYPLPVQNVYATPAEGKVGAVGKAVVAAPNAFAKFFAPLAKYFTAPAPPPKVAVKVAPQSVYAEAPTKYVSNDYDYQGYKPEVVVSSPHNYPSPAYSFSHEY